MPAPSPLTDAYSELRTTALAVAGGSADIYRRCEALRAIEADSNGNVLFPAIAVRERDVFVALYADYYFTRRYGRHPEAARTVDRCVLHMFNRVHAATANGMLLPQQERHAFFATVSEIYGEANSGIPAAAC